MAVLYRFIAVQIVDQFIIGEDYLLDQDIKIDMGYKIM